MTHSIYMIPQLTERNPLSCFQPVTFHNTIFSRDFYSLTQTIHNLNPLSCFQPVIFHNTIYSLDFYSLTQTIHNLTPFRVFNR